MAWDTYAYHNEKWNRLLDSISTGRFWRYPWESINLIASVITISLFFLATTKTTNPEFWHVIILLVYLAAAIIFAFIQSLRYARKARYADAIRIFHPIAHILRDAMYHINTMNESEFGITLKNILSALTSGFEIVTGTKVRACIKLLKVDGGIAGLQGLDIDHRREKIYAELFVHDSNSDWPNKNYSTYPNDKDRLSCNSAFCSLFRGDCNFYLENNIPRAYRYRAYENSSFTTYGKGIQGSRSWVLPYRSTILWPIRKLLKPTESTPHRKTLIETHDVLGFLCVDSASRNIWTSRYDAEIGAAVADLLYLFMDKWLENNLKNCHPAEQAIKSVDATKSQ
ncbi:MAG: hypothetical protein PHQ35_04005 [Phycisphaerae bacterium]|nr:hypothetical protein [Phycisphaerae bacterium]MDD5380318.1 hypothetical protein [Phycisphaerae bacterium]